jgi:sigma-B regulation protein RsbQ
MRPDIALLTLKSVLFGDCRQKLPLCGLPALVLQSRDDVAVPLEAAAYLAAHLPRARLELIDAEGHLPHLTDPALVQKALLAHLERCEGAGPPVAACAGSAGGHSAPASR